MKKFGEVVNDHQLAIVKKFEQLGYLLVAYSAEEVPDKIKRLKSFVPQERRPCADVVAARISTFLNELSRSKNGFFGKLTRVEGGKR
jgi:UDP-N-acetylglucosamine transferase subunit ALG13